MSKNLGDIDLVLEGSGHYVPLHGLVQAVEVSHKAEGDAPGWITIETGDCGTLHRGRRFLPMSNYLVPEALVPGQRIFRLTCGEVKRSSHKDCDLNSGYNEKETETLPPIKPSELVKASKVDEEGRWLAEVLEGNTYYLPLRHDGTKIFTEVQAGDKNPEARCISEGESITRSINSVKSPYKLVRSLTYTYVPVMIVCMPVTLDMAKIWTENIEKQTLVSLLGGIHLHVHLTPICRRGLVRCYYKCYHQGCPAGKFVEKDGSNLDRILNTKYKMDHNHPISKDMYEGNCSRFKAKLPVHQGSHSSPTVAGEGMPGHAVNMLHVPPAPSEDLTEDLSSLNWCPPFARRAAASESPELVSELVYKMAAVEANTGAHGINPFMSQMREEAERQSAQHSHQWAQFLKQQQQLHEEQRAQWMKEQQQQWAQWLKEQKQQWAAQWQILTQQQQSREERRAQEQQQQWAQWLKEQKQPARETSMAQKLQQQSNGESLEATRKQTQTEIKRPKAQQAKIGAETLNVHYDQTAHWPWQHLEEVARFQQCESVQAEAEALHEAMKALQEKGSDDSQSSDSNGLSMVPVQSATVAPDVMPMQQKELYWQSMPGAQPKNTQNSGIKVEPVCEGEGSPQTEVESNKLQAKQLQNKTATSRPSQASAGGSKETHICVKGGDSGHVSDKCPTSLVGKRAGFQVHVAPAFTVKKPRILMQDVAA